MLVADVSISDNSDGNRENGNVGNSPFAHVAENKATAMRAGDGAFIYV